MPEVPQFMLGYFAGSADTPEIQSANMVLVIPTYVDDPEKVAAAMQAHRQLAIVSMHHVFGNPRETWTQGWKQTREWMAPLERAGLVIGVYVVDEPIANGNQNAAEAISIVRGAGYRTMIGENYAWGYREPRPPVDWYGITCYEFGGEGSHKNARCLQLNADNSKFNVVIGQATDFGDGYTDQMAWYRTAKDNGKLGLIWWVYRWPGEMGAADSSEILAQHRQIAAMEGIH